MCVRTRHEGAFVGDGYRGKGHSQYLHACKRQRLAEKEKEEQEAEAAALEAAWNSERLRSGDLVGQSDGASLHMNQFTLTGVLKSAWLQLGKNKVLRVGVDGQHRGLDILAAVSSSIWLEQSDFVKQRLSEIQLDGRIPVVSKFYDCTPMRLAFGRLQPQLHVHARYPLRLADNKWTSVPLDEFLKARPDRNRSSLRYGVLELLAQGMTCHSLSSSSMFEGFRVFCRPRILQAGTASCIYTATDSEVKD
jgi:hypothetical protein